MQAKRNDPLAVSLSVKFYQSMVQIYPAAFRDSYGGLMVQAFGDSCRRAARHGSLAGLLWLWARTLMDVFLSVIEQYANRGAMMTKSKWIKLSGWFLAASGLFLLVGWAASMRPAYDSYNSASLPIDRLLNAAGGPMLFLGILFTAIGIIGLQARYGRQAGGPGQAGLILSLVGAATTLVGIVGTSIQDTSPWWELNLLGMTALFIGLGLFGISCIRRKLLLRWNSLPLVISLPWPLLFLADVLLHSVIGVPFETPWELVMMILFVSFAGLALVGILLLSDSHRSQTAAA